MSRNIKSIAKSNKNSTKKVAKKKKAVRLRDQNGRFIKGSTQVPTKTNPVAVAPAAPVKMVSIRYSTNHNAWVHADKNDPESTGEVVSTPFAMKDVQFSVHQVREGLGCGTRYANVGIATGAEISPSEVPALGWENLGFDGGKFFNRRGAMQQIGYVRLNDSRKAVIHA